MTDDLERALERALRKLDMERDRRLDERFQAQERAVAVQLLDMNRRLEHMQDSHNKLVEKLLAFAMAVPVVVVAIIVYLATASPAH